MGVHYLRCLACGREAKVNSGVKYFKLPVNIERRAKWLYAIDKIHLLHQQISRDFRVCEKHFSADMYSASENRLKMSAIPELNLLKTSTNNAAGETNIHIDIQKYERFETMEEVDKIQSTELLNVWEVFEANEPLSANENIQVGGSVEANRASREHQVTQTSFKETVENKISFDERIKPKNILALNEKVAAIRRYEIEPVYKKIGRMFNCSPDQIKRIIKQKNEILAEWENRTRKPVTPTVHAIKSVRISFLGKAVHEWIRRIMYYTDFNLNDTLIQTMAIEFSKVMGLQFYPTKEWIANFRTTYSLPDANTKTMTIGYQESHSVQIRDILRHVKEVCGTRVVQVEAKPEPDITNAAATSEASENKMETETDNSEFCTEVIIKNEDEVEEICQPTCSTIVHTQSPAEVPTELTVPILPISTNTVMPFETEMNDDTNQTEPIIKEEAAETDEIAIYTHEGAISCVKLLEDFALLKENFRLIGLIERLEEALNEK